MALPAFIYTGPEFGQKNDAIAVLKQNHAKKHPPVDEHTFYIPESKINDIFTILQNTSLFSSGRFAVIYNADQIKKKEDIEIIAEWVNISKKDSSTCVVFVSDENAVDRKLSALVPKENQKIFWELFENQKEAFVRSFFKSMKLDIDDDAINAILDLIENNTDAIKRNCERFSFLFPEGTRITQQNIEDVLVHTREESAFTLFDAMVDSNDGERLSASLDILQNLLESKSRASIQIIAGLTYSFRKLLLWHQIHTTSRPSDFDLKTKGFSSKRAQVQYRKAQRIWSAGEVGFVLALLSQTDVELRSANIRMEETLMMRLLYAICEKRAV